MEDTSQAERADIKTRWKKPSHAAALDDCFGRPEFAKRGVARLDGDVSAQSTHGKFDDTRGARAVAPGGRAIALSQLPHIFPHLEKDRGFAVSNVGDPQGRKTLLRRAKTLIQKGILKRKNFRENFVCEIRIPRPDAET